MRLARHHRESMIFLPSFAAAARLVRLASAGVALLLLGGFSLARAADAADASEAKAKKAKAAPKVTIKKRKK